MPETPPLPPVTVEPHNVRGPNAEPDEVADQLPTLDPAVEARLRAEYGHGERGDLYVEMARRSEAHYLAAVERGEIQPDPPGPHEEDSTFVDD